MLTVFLITIWKNAKYNINAFIVSRFLQDQIIAAMCTKVFITISDRTKKYKKNTRRASLILLFANDNSLYIKKTQNGNGSSKEFSKFAIDL